MSLHEAGVLAGSVSTLLFISSYLPMLLKAARTRDLSSYSPGNLVIANVGNLVHTIYVLSLPPGPLWLLHGFYMASSALMLLWWLRYRDRSGPGPAPSPDHLRVDDVELAMALSGASRSPATGAAVTGLGAR